MIYLQLAQVECNGIYFKGSKVVISGMETYYREPTNVCRELAGGISAASCNFSSSKKVSWAATETVLSGRDLCGAVNA